MSENFVVTPGGLRPQSLVHTIDPGCVVEHDHTSGKLRVLEAKTGKVVSEPGTNAWKHTGVPLRPRSGSIMSLPYGARSALLGSGWITYADWFNNTGAAVTRLATTWIVPPSPTTQSGQTIFLFNGIENDTMIYQPVLQWGPSAAGGGDYWAVASWYADGQEGHSFKSPLVRVSPGSILEGVIELTSTSGSAFSYNCYFAGIPDTSLAIQKVQELTWCVQTLEAYGVTARSDYPTTDCTRMDSIEIKTGTKDPNVQWQSVNYITDTGQHCISVSNANPGGEVDLFYDYFPTLNLAKITRNNRAADAIFRGVDNQFWIALADGHGGFSKAVQSVKHGGPVLHGQQQYADITGNGCADLIFQGVDNHFWISLADGNGAFLNPIGSIQRGGSFQIGQAQYADITGNGRADLIYQEIDNQFYIALADGKNGFKSPVASIKHGGSFQPGQAQYADITGNGCADLIFQGTDNQFWISLADGAGAFESPAVSVRHGPSFRIGQAQYADITGNGCADLIYQGTDNQFWISLANGKGQFANPVASIKHGGPFLVGQAMYADITGNHCADLIFQGIDNQFWISLANRKGGFDNPSKSVVKHGGPFITGQTHYVDITGNGLADLIFQGIDGRVWVSLADGKGDFQKPVEAIMLAHTPTAP